MSIRALAVLVAAVGAAALSLNGHAQAAIPQAHGTTLAGTAVALPDATKDKVGVLVIGFSHASQVQVAAWGRRLATDYGSSGGVAYFAIPMLAGAPKMLRGMIVKSMGKSVPEAEKPHFLPLTEDDKPWRAIAHYSKPDDAYVLGVDQAGDVEWQTEGDASDAAYSALRKVVWGLTGSKAAP
jgi:hypothetical protein